MKAGGIPPRCAHRLAAGLFTGLTVMAMLSGCAGDDRAAARAARLQRDGHPHRAAAEFLNAASASRDAGRAALHRSNAAACLAGIGQSAEAGHLLEEAARAVSTLPERDVHAPPVLANRAQWLLSDGQWEGAEAVAREAARRAEAVDDITSRVDALRIIADARRNLGRTDGAREALRSARAVAEGFRAEPNLLLSEGLLHLDSARPGAAVAPLRRAVRQAGSSGDAALEFRARLALAEALAESGTVDEIEPCLEAASAIARNARDRADVQQRRSLVHRTLGDRERAWRHAVLASRAAGSWIRAATRPDERQARRRAARGYVETVVSCLEPGESGAGPALAVETMRTLDDRIPPGSGRGEPQFAWFWGADRVTGFRRTGDGEWTAFDAGSSHELREWILLFRSLLTGPQHAATRGRVGALLRDALLPGLAEDAPAGTRLRIEPDGLLTALPFAALPSVGEDPASDKSLGASCPLLRTVRRAPARGADTPAGGVRILADPVPPRSASPGRLPGGRREAERIAALFPDAVLFLGPHARESRVGESPARLLHLATHTDAPPRPPAVLLTPGDGCDGRLTAAEIRELEHVPGIVVLSGCETLLTDAPGRTASGDLAEAFLDAGCASAIGSLWNVEDGTTGPFLVAMHRALADGERPSVALLRARRESGVTDPFVWAAFVVRGDDLPLAEAGEGHPDRS